MARFFWFVAIHVTIRRNLAHLFTMKSFKEKGYNIPFLKFADLLQPVKEEPYFEPSHEITHGHHGPPPPPHSRHPPPPPPPGMNCIKIGLPGKRILIQRKGLWEVLFS